MAQSETKRTPLGIDAFWDKTTLDPPLRWEKWRVQYKLALLAKENIILDIYTTWTQTRNGGTSPQTNIRRNYSRSFCTVGERKERSQHATKDELAKQVPTTHRKWCNVWRQTVAIGGSQNRVFVVSKHLGRRTPYPQLQEPVYHH